MGEINNKTWFAENWFQLGILVSILVIAAALYNVMVIQPKEQRLAAEAKVQTEKLEKELALQKEEAAKQVKEQQLNSCISDAKTNYNSSWDKECKTRNELSARCEILLFESQESALKQYESWNPEIVSTEEDSQKSLLAFSIAKVKCKCQLPTVAADRLYGFMKDAKNECYLRYK